MFIVYSSELCISSTVMLAESCAMDFGFRIDKPHSRDRDTFVEFRRVSRETMWIYVDNNSHVKFEGIGNCELLMRYGRVIVLRDVLHPPQISQNVITT